MKKLLACLWVLALLITTFCCAVADEPETFTSGDWEYRVLADGTAEITNYYNSKVTSIQVPETLDGVKVTDIAGGAFLSCAENTTFIVSPDHPTLAVIDGVLFSKPDKRLIAYPPAKEGNTYAIPQGIEIIGGYAFRRCTSLTSIFIPDSVTSIEFSAFDGCSSLTSITIPDSVTSIGDSAFSRCSSLTNIFIPDSVTSIEGNPFARCQNIDLVVSPDHPVFSTIDGVLFSRPDKRLISFTKVDSAYTIPHGVEIIGNSAFSDCASLTSITIPDSVTSIGKWAFWNCSSLANLSIPDSIVSIGDYAFSRCSSLTSITIPSNVTSIGYATLAGCSSLTSITIPDSVTSIGGFAFSECSSLINISIPDSVTSIGTNAFANCPNLTLTVGRNSYAEQFAKNHNISYAYKDANDWLTK